MTETETIAHNEILMLKAVDSTAEFDAQHHKNRVAEIINNLIKSTTKLIDKDGNMIGDFFVDNGIDNHHFPSEYNKNAHPSAKDLHENILDTIRAVKGDTETLLNE